MMMSTKKQPTNQQNQPNQQIITQTHYTLLDDVFNNG